MVWIMHAVFSGVWKKKWKSPIQTRQTAANIIERFPVRTILRSPNHDIQQEWFLRIRPKIPTRNLNSGFRSLKLLPQPLRAKSIKFLKQVQKQSNNKFQFYFHFQSQFQSQFHTTCGSLSECLAYYAPGPFLTKITRLCRWNSMISLFRILMHDDPSLSSSHFMEN